MDELPQFDKMKEYKQFVIKLGYTNNQINNIMNNVTSKQEKRKIYLDMIIRKKYLEFNYLDFDNLLKALQIDKPLTFENYLDDIMEIVKNTKHEALINYFSKIISLFKGENYNNGVNNN